MRALVDGSMFVEQTNGAAPTLLLLHGWGRSRQDLLGLADGHGLLSVDFPGFGASPPPPSGWGAADYADHLAEACAEDGRGPYVVVAHSFGGRVAVHLAVTHPHLVGGLVLTGVPLLRREINSTPPLGYRLIRWAAQRKLIPSSVLEKQRRKRGSEDYNAASGVMRDVFVRVVNEDYREHLRQIEAPVAFCWGAADTAAPVDLATAASRMVPDLRGLDVVDGVGHFVHTQAPDRLKAAIATVVEATR